MSTIELYATSKSRYIQVFFSNLIDKIEQDMLKVTGKSIIDLLISKTRHKCLTSTN